MSKPRAGARARPVPGQEKQVIDYYSSNPQAWGSSRSPCFRGQVIDFLG